jgi:hypothetical protein
VRKACRKYINRFINKPKYSFKGNIRRKKGGIMHKTTSYDEMRFQVLTAASMKMTVFWDVAPSCLVEVHRRFRGVCCLHRHPDDGSSKHL